MTVKKCFMLSLTAIIFSFVIFSGASHAAMHFVQKDANFNFSLKNSGWFESPLDEQYFFNLVPEMSLIIENDSQNVLLSVSPLDGKIYTQELEKAAEKMIEKITFDKDNIIFLKNDFEHNGIKFKDIIYKDKNDLSNVRVVLAKDMKKTEAGAAPIYALVFYYPKKSDFVNSEGDISFLFKTFMFKTELAEALDDNLISLGKGAECIGEYVSLYEITEGIVGVERDGKKAPLFKNPLVKYSQVLETNDGAVSFKLNDGTLGFVNSKSRLEFKNMAELKLERGEAAIRLERTDSLISIWIGNFVKLSFQKGFLNFSCVKGQDSNVDNIKIIAIEGSCNVSITGSAAQAVSTGQSLLIEISEAGKLVSAKPSSESGSALKDNVMLWAAKLFTHKIYEGINYLEKLKEFNK